MTIKINGRQSRILGLSNNSTDGQPVSTRSCLTGKEVPAYGAILIDWPNTGDKPVLKSWVEEAP
ncbi:hypothetical protein [Thalassovita mediterranea]|nr:hypothetical protein [Thalassovita mediterranea]